MGSHVTLDEKCGAVRVDAAGDQQRHQAPRVLPQFAGVIVLLAALLTVVSLLLFVPQLRAVGDK